jgi:SOS-response transcriptional repressor LexA
MMSTRESNPVSRMTLFSRHPLQGAAVLAWPHATGALLPIPLVPTPWPCLLPLFGSRIPAGFPSPADDDLEGTIDLNAQLIRHPAATFFLRVQGDSMTGAGIHDGDLLVVDREREARSGSIVVAAVDGELTLKRLKIDRG